MNFIQELLGNLNTFLYSNILLVLLVAAGLYFSIRTGFVQFRMLGEGIRLLKEKAHHHDGVSSFQALMISTASRVGTGNIAGVATALAAGGAGSIFWMWVIALIGGASAFVESTLAQIYKERDGDQFRGGPAYYIEKALQKWGGELRKHFSKERCSQTAMPFFAVFPLYFGLFLSPVQNQMHR